MMERKRVQRTTRAEERPAAPIPAFPFCEGLYALLLLCSEFLLAGLFLAGGASAAPLLSVEAQGEEPAAKVPPDVPPEDPPQEAGTSDGSAAEAVGQAEGSAAPAPLTLPIIHAQLEGLEGDLFRARLEELLAETDAPAVFDALILRAGRPVPPGLSGARSERRIARREEARAWMAEHPEWTARARGLLSAEGVDDDLRCAALESLAATGDLKWAWDLAPVLDDEHQSGWVRECARGALRELTGRDFKDRQHFESVSAGWKERTRGEIFADEFLARGNEIEQLKIELFDGHPARVTEALQSGSPSMRAAAAAAVARGVGRQGRTLDGALETLFGQLEVEENPLVLHATLEALVGLLEGLEPDSEPVEHLRSLLIEGDLGERLGLAPAVAEALARLPAEGAAQSAAAARVSVLLSTLVDARRPVDYDALSLGLDALEQLLGRPREEPGEDDAAPLALTAAIAPAREVVLELLTAEDVPVPVRLDAARVAGRVLGADSLADLLDVFKGEPSERLSLEVLGSVARLLPRLDPKAPPVARLIGVLEGLTGSANPDLRRRAVELLGAQSPVGLRERVKAAGIAGRLTARMIEEPVPAVRDALITTLTGLGPAPTQARLLASAEGFDGWLDGNHRRSQRMGRCLRALVGGDGEAARIAAERLAWDRRGEVPSEAPSPLDRLRAALDVATGPPAAAVAAWPAADHSRVVGWALECLEGGVALEPEVLDRLIAVHLENASGLAPLDGARLWVARDLVRRERGLERDVAGVNALLEGILSQSQDRREAVLLRARWRMVAGEAQAALVDWRELLFPGDVANAKSGLAPADLRLARDAFAAEPQRAARVALFLVDDPAWMALDPGVRLADLLAMADLALASKNEGLLRAAMHRLEGVPQPSEDGADTTLPEAPPGAAWAGTLQRRADHVALARRARALEEALPAPANPVKPPEKLPDKESDREPAKEGGSPKQEPVEKGPTEKKPAGGGDAGGSGAGGRESGADGGTGTGKQSDLPADPSGEEGSTKRSVPNKPVEKRREASPRG